MTRIQIVTDSSAQFIDPHFLDRNPVTVAYNLVEVDGKLYREGTDITNEEVLHLMAQTGNPPAISSPTVHDYLQLYTRLSQQAKGIISIHGSRELYQSWHHAQEAARQLAGHCEIVVIDSQTLCVAQGILTQVAVQAIQEFDSMDDCVRHVRGAIERTYSVFCVDTVDFLRHNTIMKASHVLLSDLLGIKPFLTIEEGELRPIEKVRTKSQSVERMVEFVVEFDDLEATAIVHNKPFVQDQIKTLKDRLTMEFPQHDFPHMVYAPSLAALLGPDAMGVVILEQEYDEFADDF